MVCQEGKTGIHPVRYLEGVSYIDIFDKQGAIFLKVSVKTSRQDWSVTLRF
jgi:hypothetical protein